MSQQWQRAVSRRDFLRGTAAVAGGLMAATGTGPAAAQAKGPVNWLSCRS